ncbi:probable F-box protein At4g22060 [Arachis duranensis]|uniref:Probable F-box protein At4g22060 n=1 Tax=Arachis duranensis TaxID=130453 RepID=A0A6P4C0A2_ARADU|nr:probable F-box protein At4g22060 [Arachis duranensis]
MASLSLSVPYAILPSIQQTHLIDDDDDPITVDRSIFNLAEKKRYEWKNMLKDHVGAWCIGSSHGWIGFLDQNGVPFLLNPSSSTTINLPPLPLSFLHPLTYSYFAEHLRKTFIAKAILMCYSSPSSYTLAIIYGCNYKIAYCNSTTWVELSNDRQSYCDIVFSNNHLYALTQDGSIEVWNISGPVPTRWIFLTPTMEVNYEEEKPYFGDNFSTNLYLVVSGEDILLVKRFIGNFVNDDGLVVEEGDLLSSEDTQPLICPYRTKYFTVYKLDIEDKKWKKMKSLHDKILFLGANESVSMDAKACLGCEANSIYFTDDRWEEMNLDYMYGGHDWGVFNLQEKYVKSLIQCADRIDPPPIWVVPVPQNCNNLHA